MVQQALLLQPHQHECSTIVDNTFKADVTNKIFTTWLVKAKKAKVSAQTKAVTRKITAFASIRPRY